MGKTRLWALEEPPGWRLGQRPDEVVWDAPNAAEILKSAEELGFKIIGPFVLEQEPPAGAV